MITIISIGIESWLATSSQTPSFWEKVSFAKLSSPGISSALLLPFFYFKSIIFCSESIIRRRRAPFWRAPFLTRSSSSSINGLFTARRCTTSRTPCRFYFLLFLFETLVYIRIGRRKEVDLEAVGRRQGGRCRAHPKLQALEIGSFLLRLASIWELIPFSVVITV